MKRILNYKLTYIIFILINLNCNSNPPCSFFDSSCSTLGYLVPNLILQRSSSNLNSGATTTATSRITFSGVSNLRILSATSVELRWSAATSTASGGIEYNIYSSTTSGSQNFITPIQTVTNTTSAIITGIPSNTNNYYIVRAKDSTGTVDTNTVERAALLNGLIRYIPLDSTPLATGERIGNAVVTAVATPILNATDRFGVANNAFTLNGTTQYFTFSSTGLPGGNSDRTFCMWVKMNNNTTNQRFISYGIDSPNQIIGLVYNGIPIEGLNVTTFSGTEILTNFESGELNAFSWNHYCVTLKSSFLMSLFVNGNPRVINYNQLSVNTSIGGSASIGTHNTTFAQKLIGSISEVIIWNRALTAAELLSVFRN